MLGWKDVRARLLAFCDMGHERAQQHSARRVLRAVRRQCRSGVRLTSGKSFGLRLDFAHVIDLAGNQARNDEMVHASMAIKDIQPLTLLGQSSNILMINLSLPVHSVQDLIKLAKAKPGAIHFGSSGIGISNHFAGEMLKLQASVNIIHVPYKGGAQAMADVIAGHIPMMFNGFAAALALV
jgi:hypothetical protein